ncbi:MAG: hypothetical protein R3F43_29105 [bacterium]
MSIVSNEAFNRLYELAAAPRGLNRRMQAAGLNGTVFTHRLSRILSDADNRKTPRIDLETPDGVTLPRPPAPRRGRLPLPRCRASRVGDAYLEPGTGDKRVETPMSFADKNRMSLVDLQNMLVMIMRPDVIWRRAGLQAGGQEFSVPEEARQRRASRRIVFPGGQVQPQAVQAGARGPAAAGAHGAVDRLQQGGQGVRLPDREANNQPDGRKATSSREHHDVTARSCQQRNNWMKSNHRVCVTLFTDAEARRRAAEGGS